MSNLEIIQIVNKVQQFNVNKFILSQMDLYIFLSLNELTVHNGHPPSNSSESQAQALTVTNDSNIGETYTPLGVTNHKLE